MNGHIFLEVGRHGCLSVGQLALKNIILKLKNSFSHKPLGVLGQVKARWKEEKILFKMV